MSSSTKNPLGVAQSGNVTFELHTLGWEAFQNLCGHVAREVLGQTVTAFSNTNDAGQDGAFQGVWQRDKNDAFRGRFVIQCKFTSRRDEHLTISQLRDELSKVRALADQGLAQTYLLISNAKVSGEADKAIRETFLQINGIQYFELFGGEWITQQILASKRLRAFVPRIYGLGDLTQILDERVYRQANEILQNWKANLATFVPTDAHHKSVKALLDEGFVLLLGDPMAGKSTIAASLALTAADQWNSLPIFVSHPDEFKAHWNPDQPNQFFWVDDAFGQIQFEASLAQGWNRMFPHLKAALRHGARVMFTSRNYIYQAAQRELKEGAFPLLANSRVVILVEKLSLQEKERILYNHLRLGNQSREFRASLKQFLPAIASNPKFFPEVAKRLGDPFFTKNLIFHEDYLRRFVEEPKEFLHDIITQLDRNNFAALALLFMRAGRIAIPPRLDSHEIDAMALLGVGLAQLREALVSLEDSLVSVAIEAGEHFWKFRHPSVRDAMALYVAARPELIDIYLAGVRVSELLVEVVCGNIEIEGAKVIVPNSRFAAVIAKINPIDFKGWPLKHNLLIFLSMRSSPEFLAAWFSTCFDDFEKLFRDCAVSNYFFCLLLTQLHRTGSLPEKYRREFVTKATNEAVSSAEITFLNESFRDLITADEIQTIFIRIKEELVPALEEIIDTFVSDYSGPDDDPDDYFYDLRSNFEELRNIVEDEEVIESLKEGEEWIDAAIRQLKRRNEKEIEQQEDGDPEYYDEALTAMVAEYERADATVAKPGVSSLPRAPVNTPPRNIFDDVDS